MLKRTMVLCAAAAVILGSGLEAQNQAVIAAQPSQYQTPNCEPLRSGHFKVKSGATYVQSALGSATNRDRLLGDADRVLREALREGQQNSAMAWYWLGRVYLYRGDLAGADSSLKRAEQLAPECASDYRQIKLLTAQAIMKPAADFREAGQLDSAMGLLRMVLAFQPDNPNANYEMGIIFYNLKQLDSAAVNFQAAVAATEERAATDSNYAAFRNQALFNLAAVYQNGGKHKEAIETLRRYLTVNPTDDDARRALANSFRATGMPDSASAIERTITSQPTSGTAGPAAGATGAFNRGIDAFNAKDYAGAASAFNEYLTTNPRSREALYNLASTYYAMSNADSLISVGERLIALDPLNDNNLRLLAGGYQMKKNQDQMIKYAILITELPVNIEVAGFQTGAAAATWAGTATGRAARNQSDQPIAPAAMTLVFEFLDAQGSVIATQEVPVRALPEGEKQDLSVVSQTAGIVAWRYKKK
jgi:tetratricopeptide (TPR) repeat protein